MTQMTRRRFGALATGALGAFALGDSCFGSVLPGTDPARIPARPKPGGKTTAQGTRALGLDGSRDAILQMPAKAAADPMPLIVLRSTSSNV